MGVASIDVVLLVKGCVIRRKCKVAFVKQRNNRQKTFAVAD